MEFKICKMCKEEKPLDSFYKRKSKLTGNLINRESACKVCTNKKHKERKANWTPEQKKQNYQNQREWEKNNQERHLRNVRKSDLKNKYGLTLEDFDRMLVQQNGLCAICNKPETKKSKILHVDHCHTTGKVRGLLCHCCNTALGSFEDSVENLESAITYLKKTTNE